MNECILWLWTNFIFVHFPPSSFRPVSTFLFLFSLSLSISWCFCVSSSCWPYKHICIESWMGRLIYTSITCKCSEWDIFVSRLLHSNEFAFNKIKMHFYGFITDCPLSGPIGFSSICTKCVCSFSYSFQFCFYFQ